jgi:hypothetical protein
VQEGIMLSETISFTEFVNQIAKQPYDEIILLTDREATAAERHCCKTNTASGQNSKMETYALLLKDFMLYKRYGVATSALRDLGCQSLKQLPRA